LTDTATGMSVGRANAVFVFGRGENTTSIVSPVVVRVNDQSDTVRMRFTGSVSFDNNAVEHLFESVLPTADNILMTIGLPKKFFEISIVNFEVASIRDVASKISGFSADVPILIAILSACLQVPVQEDIVLTGHIASPDGDIRMVKNFPSKLSAVVKSRSNRTFIHPVIDADHSLSSLSPSEKQRIEHAVEEANQKIRLVSVHDVEDLVRTVFNDHQIVMASLKQAFFGSPTSRLCGRSPCTKAVDYLTKNIEKRFWSVLECQLISAKVYEAKKLLQAFISFHINRKSYPKLFGTRLSNLIFSLPPDIRRFKLKYPLMPISKHIQLSQFAQESDYEDILMLFKVASAETRGTTGFLSGADTESKKDAILDSAEGKLDIIQAEISAEALATKFGIQIDSARATYVIDSVIVKSYGGFYDSTISFFAHLIRHTRNLSDPVDMKVVGAEAFELLEKAFSREGGVQAAYAEALCGLRGGMKLVIDQITEAFKKEEQYKYVNFVFKAALDPLDWDGKVALMGELLKRLKNHLPSEIVSQPPERYARYYDTILRAYINSVDQVKSLFRSY